MKVTFALIGIVAILLVSCQKEENAVDFYYNETLCSDPWDDGQNDSDAEIEKAVKNYLKDQNIKAFSVEVDHSNDLTIVCEACHCHSGTKIIVSADESKESKMGEIGFIKQ